MFRTPVCSLPIIMGATLTRWRCCSIVRRPSLVIERRREYLCRRATGSTRTGANSMRLGRPMTREELQHLYSSQHVNRKLSTFTIYSPMITCQSGLESILSEELVSLRLPNSVVRSNQVILKSPVTLDDIRRCHLFLGTASDILLPLHSEPFVARSMHQLQRKAQRLPWASILGSQLQQGKITLKIKVTSSKSKLLHTTAIRDCVLKSIYSSLGMDAQGQVQSHEQAQAHTVSFQVSVIRDMFTIALLTSSSPLHQRGYRLETAKAPLREDIAYGLLYAAGWTPQRNNDREFSHQTTGLLDPFCGSGTIAIEAAAVAMGLPPGRLRPSPFLGTLLHDEYRWVMMKKDSLKVMEGKVTSVLVQASDRDMGAIKIATSNAARAGVLDNIEFTRCAASNQPVFENPAKSPTDLLIVTNPPFGRRIRGNSKSQSQNQHALLPLYQTLANKITILRQLKHDVSAMVLVQDQTLATRGMQSLSIEPRLQLSHGGLRVHGLYSQ